MKAAVFHGPGRVRVEEVPRPELDRGGMVIRVRAATVCATDVKTWRHGHPLITPPVILGHELTGVTTEVDGAAGYAAGDRVAVAPYVECGRCFHCRHRVAQLCEHKAFPSNGAFAEFVGVSAAFAGRGVVKMPDDAPKEAGAFAEPLACVLSGLDETGFRDGEFVAVIGAGPMGLLHVLVLRHRAAGVVVSEPLPPRRAKALELGADVVLPEEAEAHIFERTSGRGADVVCVAVGHPEVAADSLRLARKGGRVLWFGGFAPDAQAVVDPNIVHYRQVTIHGSSGFSSRQFRRAAKMLSQGVDPTPLITHRFALDGVAEALETAAGLSALKVALLPG